MTIWQLYLQSDIITPPPEQIWVGKNALAELPLPYPIHIITARNPHEHILSEAENQTRTQALLALLKQQTHTPILEVYGCSPDRHWQEQSFAVSGLTRIEVCQLAQRFQQRGIFELTEHEVLVLDQYAVCQGRKLRWV